MRRLVRSVVTSATVVLTLVATPVVARAADNPFDHYLNQELAWGPCLFAPIEGMRPTECALVTVPRDWAAPAAGVDLRVSISRAKATGERLGAILINPGGPGGQGTSLAGMLAALQPAVSERYDFVGMDPRGTGHEGGTTPEQLGLVCEIPIGRLSTRTDLDARDRSPESIAEHQKAPRAIAEACQSEALTPFITTWQTAHDMELIRQLLGDSTLNYLGYSYGTWLGAKYASLFPGSAGKMILDSSVNWQGRLQAAFEAFPMIGQRQLDDVYLPWTARQFPEIVGATPAEAARTWEQARDYVKTLGISGDDYDSLFVGMGNQLQWLLATLIFTLAAQEMNGETPETGVPDTLRTELDALARTEYGVPLAELTLRRIAAEAPDDYAPFPGTRIAVACGDQPTRSAAWYRNLSDRQGPRYPLFGWAYGISEPCGFWSDAPRQSLPNLPAEVASKILVVQAEFDPQTGYEQARAAVRAAPGVTLVSVDDATFHGQYAVDGNPCVDGMVNVFLLHNSRPSDATCPAVPLPNETEVHPVAGPVKRDRDKLDSAARLAAERLPELREQVRERIALLDPRGPVAR
ncbi:alpha/beta hydrolase [Plantactinospora sp. CA-290183]|uniref:alpha/beta hydrolase n=1 Tax=Plantactinospora sp. CA-290183 TaxID=3240006 RepID=UPI003D905FDE